MKKLALTIFLSFAAIITFAQTIHYGFKGGYNIESQTISGNYEVAVIPDLKEGIASILLDKWIHQSTPGFNIGGFMNIDLHHFTIQPGLTYTTKGDKFPSQPVMTMAYPIGFTIPEVVYRLSYLELSCNGLYNFHIVPGADIHLGAGVFKARGMAASYTYGGVKKAATFSTSQHIDVHFKDPDYGFNFIAGIALGKKVLLDYSYSLGMANISTDGGASTVKNRVTSISLGYLFR